MAIVHKVHTGFIWAEKFSFCFWSNFEFFWSRPDQTTPNESKWVQMGLNVSKWLKMVPNGSLWVQLGPNESKLIQMARNSLKRLEMAQNGSKMTPSGSKWPQIAPNGSKWLQMVPNGSNQLQMAPNGSKWLKITTLGSKQLQMSPNSSKRLQIAQNCSKYFQIAPPWLKKINPKGSKWVEFGSKLVQNCPNRSNKDKYKDQVGHVFDLWSFLDFYCMPKRAKMFRKVPNSSKKKRKKLKAKECKKLV